MSKAITREQLRSLQKSTKQYFIDWVVDITRKQVERDVKDISDMSKPVTESISIFLISRSHIAFTQDIYAELKDYFPDSYVQVKVLQNNKFSIPCWKQYLIEIKVRWD
jgi:hypothetical protein